jgi:hypothetical protein
MGKIDINQKIPTHLAFIIIIVLSFLLSWYTVSEGEKISNEARNSKAFNLEKRLGEEIFEK